MTIHHLVCPVKTHGAEGGAGQPSIEGTVAGGTLPLRQGPTDNTLHGRGGDGGRNIQQSVRENPVIHLELVSKPTSILSKVYPL